MRYDLESNLIAIELGRGKIDQCFEIGSLLIHVSKNKTPLLVEILDGGKLLSQLGKIHSIKPPAASKVTEGA